MPHPSRRIQSALLCAPLLLANPPAPRGVALAGSATGRIDGSVVLSAALTSHRQRFRTHEVADLGPGGRRPASMADELRNVVVYLRRVHAPAGVQPTSTKIAQDGEQFKPHILPVYRGATVAFSNDDDIHHSVFSLSSAKTFDLGRNAKGSTRSVVFDRSGTVQVFCHIHPDMSAVVLVLDNPYYAMPSDAGRYAIDGIPPGDYVLIAWHEHITPVSRPIHVAAGETSRVNFNIAMAFGPEDVTR